MEKVKVTLVKSIIGTKPNQKATVKSLGLKKIGDSIGNTRLFTKGEYKGTS